MAISIDSERRGEGRCSKVHSGSSAAACPPPAITQERRRATLERSEQLSCTLSGAGEHWSERRCGAGGDPRSLVVVENPRLLVT
eukprot:scaffold122241_cov35-Tisochrysis_lutea.AAC.1